MKHIGLLFAALLFVNAAAAKSTKLVLSENLVINFVDIVPYGNIAYSYQSRELIPTDVSMSFNGELSYTFN